MKLKDEEEIRPLVKKAIAGSREAQERVVAYCDFYCDYEVEKRFCAEVLPNFTSLTSEVELIDLAIALRKVGNKEKAISTIRKVANEGSWRAQYRLGYWLLEDFDDFNGFTYLKMSSGRGHREGSFAFHVQSRKRSKGIKRLYHLFAGLLWIPAIAYRWEKVGSESSRQ